jgi:hypothetical protein
LPAEGSEPIGIDPFPPAIALEYKDYLEASTNRSVLTSRCRAEMKEILRNPTVLYTERTVPDRNKRGRLNNLKSWTLKHFILDDNQIYRKAKVVCGIEYNRRYAVCIYNSFELISRVHRALFHAGIALPSFEFPLLISSRH